MSISYGAAARRTLRACAAVAAASTLSAIAPLSASATSLNAALSQITAQMQAATTANCATPAFSEPFAAFGDTNQYALLPGESADSFTGTGWTLLGGAKITSAKLYDGTTGKVLDLPAGSIAFSPATCVNSTYITARALVRDVAGSATLTVYDSPQSTSPSLISVGATAPSSTNWTAMPAINLTPITVSTWQDEWFTLSDSGAETQVYDLYIDPRMKS